MKNKVISIILCVFVLLVSFFSLPKQKNVEAFSINSKAYAVLECSTNRLLYSKNKDEKLPMASTTKVMTAVLALEKGSLNDVVEIKKEYTGIEGTSIYLKEGEKLTLEDLLHGMMLVSGNDAAVAVAYHIGGSIEGFAKMMNEKAKELGMKNTNFKNPNGLPDDEHYTTAYDFALLASYAMKNENFVKIINDKKWSMSYEGKENGRVIYNRNKLLNSFDGSNGVKTGYTKKAGKCFVFAAKRNDMQVVGVVLKSADHYTDSKNLLDMSFSNYKMEKIIEKGEYIKTLPLKNSKKGITKLTAENDIYFPLKDGEKYKVDYKKVYNSGSDNYILNYSVNVNNETYSYSEHLAHKNANKGIFYKFTNIFKNFVGI